jgi:aminotransferase
MPEYQICARCVMDTSDPDIKFDKDGVCNHCHFFDKEIKPRYFPDESGLSALKEKLERIKRENRNREYDCIIGLSGGIDSSYMAVKMSEFELRPLILHVDGGWNTEIAVNNIRAVVDYCNWELHTVVINWEEMKDLQISYLKSGISNQDVPQDHAFFAALYTYAVKNDIRHVFSGGNLSTEAIFPYKWHYTAFDGKNMKAIQKKYGTIRLKTFPVITLWDYYFYYPFIKGLKVLRPLNFMPYDRKKALEELKNKIGYKDYGAKHCESIFTKYFQRYYLPTRYGYDTRKPHLSSEILTGYKTREQVLEELKIPSYDENELKEDKKYVMKKLGLGEEEFEKLLQAPKRCATEFSSDVKLLHFVKFAQKLIAKRLNIVLRRYF